MKRRSTEVEGFSASPKLTSSDRGKDDRCHEGHAADPDNDAHDMQGSRDGDVIHEDPSPAFGPLGPLSIGAPLLAVERLSSGWDELLCRHRSERNDRRETQVNEPDRSRLSRGTDVAQAAAGARLGQIGRTCDTMRQHFTPRV
jgi:hypothetical protein